MKVIVFGYEGKVGSVIAAGLGAAGHEILGVEVGDDVPQGADAAVDFTQPDAVVGNVERCLERAVPVVVGTTGWEAQRERVDAAARDRGVAVFAAPNFSIGAVLMMRFAAEAARHLPRAEIVELHHHAKQDAPSGTALALGRAIAAARGLDFERAAVLAREGLVGPRRGDEIGIVGLRAGDAVGDHTVLFGGLGERLELLLALQHSLLERSHTHRQTLLRLIDDVLNGLESFRSLHLDQPPPTNACN